jgi:hypothetical protein
MQSLPENIPAPKFQLFQQVRIKGDRSLPEVGCITGLYYIDFRNALSDGLDMGWKYTVDFLIAATEEEALTLAENRIDAEERELEMANKELLDYQENWGVMCGLLEQWLEEKKITHADYHAALTALSAIGFKREGVECSL